MFDPVNQGGWGMGFIESRDGQPSMVAKVVGNPQHPSWRAWAKETGDDRELRVEAIRDGSPKFSIICTAPLGRMAALCVGPCERTPLKRSTKADSGAGGRTGASSKLVDIGGQPKRAIA